MENLWKFELFAGTFPRTCMEYVSARCAKPFRPVSKTAQMRVQLISRNICSEAALPSACFRARWWRCRPAALSLHQPCCRRASCTAIANQSHSKSQNLSSRRAARQQRPAAIHAAAADIDLLRCRSGGGMGEDDGGICLAAMRSRGV